MMNILVVEDELLMANLIRSIILNIPEVKKVDLALDYRKALKKISTQTYHMALVDLHLSQENHNGIELCRRIRNRDPFKPILVITSDTSFESQKKAFGIHVNDYIKKPFYPQELILRVQRWLPRKIKYKSPPSIHYHQLSYSTKKNEFHFEGKKIPLTKKKKELLLYFVQNPNRILTPESIQEKLWGEYNPLENRNIRSNIQLLRNSLKDTPCNRWIITIRGEGYMLKK